MLVYFVFRILLFVLILQNCRKFLRHLKMKAFTVSNKEGVPSCSGNMQPTQLPACFSVSLLPGSVVGL